VIALFGIDKDPKELIRGSHALLHVMEGELQKQDFLAGDRATIADVANYSSGRPRWSRACRRRRRRHGTKGSVRCKAWPA
jgi:glutathione S-transferase